MKVLNLFAGLGGNRKNWTDVEATAVELDPKIAAIYTSLHPKDVVVVGDAHDYLTEHFSFFDFIWSSPPCQSHSKMDRANCRNKPRYADMMLYQQIIFLQTYHKGLWVVENVVPYYTPLIEPTTRIGRHLFWSNFPIEASDVERPKGFIASGGQSTADDLKEWLGLRYQGNLYYGSNHCPAQVLRNCVHPKLGEQVMASALAHLNGGVA